VARGPRRRAGGSYAIGEERYSALLTEKEGLSYGARELRERGQAAYDELAAEIGGGQRRSPGTRLAGTAEELNGDHPATTEEMRQGYADATARAREFCIDHDLVTLPAGEECGSCPSPAFQRPIWRWGRT
jgi:hypothetical protein